MNPKIMEDWENGWREAVGKRALSNSDTLVQKVQNIQKVQTSGAFVPSVPFVERIEKVKGYPIPTDEIEYAADEREAIVEFDGGTDQSTVVDDVLRVFQGQVVGSAV